MAVCMLLMGHRWGRGQPRYHALAKGLLREGDPHWGSQAESSQPQAVLPDVAMPQIFAQVPILRHVT